MMNIRQHFIPPMFTLIRNAVIIFCAIVAPVQAAVTDIDTSPMGTSSAVNAAPNVMVMLDDSGSMDWDYMPDKVAPNGAGSGFSGYYGFNSAHCNGVYYNPNTTYTIPVDSTGIPLNSGLQTSFTSAYNDGYNTSAGTVNLNTQFPGGSGSGSSGAPSYSGPAFYYTYCSSTTTPGCSATGKTIGTQTQPWQMNYYPNTSGTYSTFYNECSSGTVLTSSGAPTVPPSTAPFTLTVMSSVNPVTTISVTNASGVSPASITVGSSTSSSNAIGHVYVGSGTATQIWGSTSTSPSSSGSSKTSTTIASYIARGINACTSSIVSPCTVTGYSATCTGYPNCTSSLVTLTGPGSSSGLSPLVSNSSGSITYTYASFPVVTSTAVTHIMVGATDLLSGTATAATNTNTTLATYIKNGINATGYSATVSGNVITITDTESTHAASGLTPVITTSPAQGGSGVLTVTPSTFSTSSSGAQLQNFANWYSYYSHRMLMMKSGLGLAFQPITSKYRVGFMTMNNNVSPDFVDILPFAGGCTAGSGTCQKDLWYSKLYSSIASNSTPLREALSHVGQLYAHKFGTITQYTTTITVGGSGSTGVTSVTVNGTETLNCAFTGKICPVATTTSAVAANIANQINAMDQTDYGATASGNVVTITGIAGSVGYAPVINNDGGGMTFTTTAFVQSSSTTAKLNGVTPLDPMQYSCQQNFVILSTDGFWNGPNTYNLSNNAVGQQDGNEPRPMNDGWTPATQSTTQVLQSTSQLTQIQSSTSTLQQATATLQWATNLQQATGKLMKSTANTYTSTVYRLQVSSTSNGTYSGASKSTAYTCITSGTSSGSSVYCKLGTQQTSVTSLPSCVVTYNNPGTSTTDSSKNVITACTPTAWNTATAVGANGTCAGDGVTVQCSNAGTAAYVSTYPPTCTNTFNGASASSTADSSGNVTTCTTSGTWNPANSASTCTPGTNVQCQYANGGWSPASTCTTNLSSGSGMWNITSGTACQYSPPVVTNTSSCTAVPGSTSSPYSVASAVTCSTPFASSSCTPGTNGCSTVNTGPTAVASCTGALASSANNYTNTTCNTVTTGPTPVSSCTAIGASSSNNYTATSCTAGSAGQTGGDSKGTLADVAEYYYITDLRDNSLGNCTGVLGVDVCLDDVPISNLDTQTQQHMTTFTLGLGARGSMVFNPNYQSLTASCNPVTDGDFCAVLLGSTAAASTSTTLPATCSWQTSGACNWPAPSSGLINNIDDLWHAAVNGRGTYYSATDPSSLATGLSSTLAGISARLGTSAAAATSSPNVQAGNNFVFSSSFMTVDWTGDVIRESINLTSGGLNCTGTPVCLPIIDWDAQAALDTLAGQAAAGGSRNIYTYNPSGNSYAANGDPAWLNNGNLKSFIWSNLTNTEQNYFSSNYISTGHGLNVLKLTQTLPTTEAGSNLVNYLRGDTSNYGTYYRARAHILGDVVDSKVAYVGQPSFSYGDTNYFSFVTAQASRNGMVYVGANDGMLHAFNAGGATITAGDGSGAEVWAYIPARVEPYLYLLADTSYSTQHHFFVDGSPIYGDICPNAPSSTCSSTQWKSILVGGLNNGGSGYYALDVTNPTQPKALWEFTDPNMGYSFGNPQITKLSDGTWVVLVTSGYNNVPSPNDNLMTGDGVGRLYVLNANTGALIRTISTGVGSVGSPSGLAHISARVNDPSSDNTALEVYGGDLLGNLWRFDINNNVGSSLQNYEAQLIITLQDSSGNAQPITTKPEIGIVSGQIVVFVGTGKFLGSSDLTNTLVQTMYGIKDPLTVSTTASPGTAIYTTPPQGPGTNSTCTSTLTTNCFVQQTAVNTTCPSGSPATICLPGYPVRTGSNNSVSFSTQSGWYINFPDSGERDYTDPVLVLGTLAFTTNTPSTANACSVGGYSDNWFINYSTGAPVSTSTTSVISTELGTHNSDGSIAKSGFSTSPTAYTTPDGKKYVVICGPGGCIGIFLPVSGGGGATRRTSWRELIRQ